MINYETLKNLDENSNHYLVEFRGQYETQNLIDWLHHSEWEFDYYLSEQLLRVLQLVNYSPGLTVTYGREGYRVLYFELTAGYEGIRTYQDSYDLLDKIYNIGWQGATEFYLIGFKESRYPNEPKSLPKGRKLRIWFDKI